MHQVLGTNILSVFFLGSSQAFVATFSQSLGNLSHVTLKYGDKYQKNDDVKDWAVDYVTVRDINTQKMYYFPAFRTLRAGDKIKLKKLDGSVNFSTSFLYRLRNYLVEFHKFDSAFFLMYNKFYKLF